MRNLPAVGCHMPERQTNRIDPTVPDAADAAI
jgi:hypothetical protein